MTPILGLDHWSDEPCVILAFTPDGVYAICAFGPLPGGTFRRVHLSDLTFDSHPPDWPGYLHWAPKPDETVPS